MLRCATFGLLLLMFAFACNAQPSILVTDLFILASREWAETHERVTIICTHLNSTGSSDSVPICFANEASIIDNKPYLDSTASPVTVWNATSIEASSTLNLNAAGRDLGPDSNDPKLMHLNIHLWLDLKAKTVQKITVATRNGRSTTIISNLNQGS